MYPLPGVNAPSVAALSVLSLNACEPKAVLFPETVNIMVLPPTAVPPRTLNWLAAAKFPIATLFKPV